MSTAAQFRFRRVKVGLALALTALALGGCASGKWGFPYKAPVQQGNWITKEQVALLQPGMTREQVRFALGSPTLTSVLHADRWEYPYYFKPGYGPSKERKFTVFFESDHLTRWEGDAQPDLQPYQSADTNAKRVQKTGQKTERAEQRGEENDNAQKQVTPRVGVTQSGNALNNMPGAAGAGAQPLR